MRQHLAYIRNQLPDRLPQLPEYQSALAYCNAVKPFARGNNIGDKPLGANRKYSRFQIRVDAERDDVVVKHYSTDILTYLNDGSLLIDSGHNDTISTCQALQELLGSSYFVRKKGKVYYKDRNGHFFRTSGGLRINADKTVSETQPPEKYYKLNLKRFRDLKAKYKFFLNYAKQMNTLTQGGCEKETTLMSMMLGPNGESSWQTRPSTWAVRTDAYALRWYGQNQPDLRRRFLEMVEQTRWVAGVEKQYEAMYPLAQYLSFCSAVDWNISKKRVVGAIGQIHDPDTMKYEYTWTTTNKRLENFFGEILKHQFPLECFDLVEAERGKITHDANRKYIPQTP